MSSTTTTFNPQIVIISGTAGVVQLTSASGGNGLPGLASGTTVYLTLQPYSGATAVGNIYVAGGGEAPYQDSDGVWVGYRNPASVKLGGQGLHIVTDQSGYFLAYVT